MHRVPLVIRQDALTLYLTLHFEQDRATKVWIVSNGGSTLFSTDRASNTASVQTLLSWYWDALSYLLLNWIESRL